MVAYGYVRARSVRRDSAWAAFRRCTATAPARRATRKMQISKSRIDGAQVVSGSQRISASRDAATSIEMIESRL